jgi:hypothetical protein
VAGIPESLKLTRYIVLPNRANPIEWIAYTIYLNTFSSVMHSMSNAGKIACETCHGAVAEMNIMKQVEDLSMGWCINCHRDSKVNFKDNQYYSTYLKLHEELKVRKDRFNNR